MNDGYLRDLVANVYDFTVGLDLPSPNHQVAPVPVSGYALQEEKKGELCEPSSQYGEIKGEDDVVVSETSVHKIRISSTSFGKFNDKKKR